MTASSSSATANRYILRMREVIAEHGNSWKNKMVPYIVGETPDTFGYTRHESDDKGYNAYGLLWQEVCVSGADACKPWAAMANACELMAGVQKDANGVVVFMRIRMVNLGAYNRMRDPKCTPRPRFRGITCVGTH